MPNYEDEKEWEKDDYRFDFDGQTWEVKGGDVKMKPLLKPSHDPLPKDADPINYQIGGDHYQSKIQHVEFVEANNMPYLEAQVFKYIVRHQSKNGIEDLRKALHYLEFTAHYRYGESLHNKT